MAEIQPVMIKIRVAAKKFGSQGIRGLQLLFKRMDEDGSKNLDKRELKDGLEEFGVKLSQPEIEAVMKQFDRDGSGKVSFDEFLKSLRGELNPTRMALVERAFKLMDKDGSGSLTLADINGVYNAKKHPKVLSGEKTEAQVLQEFLASFEEGSSSKDGTITWDEWVEYYAGISASIGDNDEYFVTMMNSAWKFA